MSAINETSCLPLSKASPSEQMVQIPASTLTTLLSSIESLRNEVSLLKESHSDISTQLTALQKNNGAAFPLFRKLPIELRTMIWRYALTSIPQIHVLGDSKISRSNVNSVVESCKEAWDEAKHIQIDFLVIETRKESDLVTSLYGKSYINLEIDIFWFLNDKNIGFGVPNAVLPCCGKCIKKQGLKSDFFNKGLDYCPEKGIECNVFPIRKLVIHADSWENPTPFVVREDGDIDFSEGIIHFLRVYKVEELLIIVGESDPDPNTVFVEPAWIGVPDDFLDKFFDLGPNGPDLWTWSELEADIVKAFQIYKDLRAIERKTECEEQGITEEELDRREPEPWDERFGDLSTWKLPKVRFVQARSTDPKWIPHS